MLCLPVTGIQTLELTNLECLPLDVTPRTAFPGRSYHNLDVEGMDTSARQQY